MRLQTNDAGELVLPPELVQAPPHTALEVKRQGDSVVIQIVAQVPESGSARGRFVFDFPTLPGRFIDEIGTFRREELYDDDGR
ncbi:MAG TPA: hypothetical protein VG168_06370 [Bryobacteraceae bacterium]|nr:hypothetical protein [Bryobacteraceae bacterium]